jgi:hypothetical protein
MQNHTELKFQNIRYQQGWTFWSLLFVMSVILFFAYVGMQLVPIYSTNGNITNAMSLSLDDQDLTKLNRATVIRKINAQLYLDGTHQILNYKTDLKVRRSRKEFILETHYRREIPLFYNLSIIASFDNVESRPLRRDP